ncbi:hypothetical protein [Lysinibacter cavernae]|uniref:DUF4179 domain-containing protein n=1 Tax=Lysinibacter cavernae TaxID=1640652 RepID=A0A7X5R0P1_9MICO|nr:hypothetical protein [Lysinibacter cavernae]NIH53352.1 hypothetical protein [Lysinibacter cavernae]
MNTEELESLLRRSTPSNVIRTASVHNETDQLLANVAQTAALRGGNRHLKRRRRAIAAFGFGGAALLGIGASAPVTVPLLADWVNGTAVVSIAQQYTIDGGEAAHCQVQLQVAPLPTVSEAEPSEVTATFDNVDGNDFEPLGGAIAVSAAGDPEQYSDAEFQAVEEFLAGRDWTQLAATLAEQTVSTDPATTYPGLEDEQVRRAVVVAERADDLLALIETELANNGLNAKKSAALKLFAFCEAPK